MFMGSAKWVSSTPTIHPSFLDAAIMAFSRKSSWIARFSGELCNTQHYTSQTTQDSIALRPHRLSSNKKFSGISVEVRARSHNAEGRVPRRRRLPREDDVKRHVTKYELASSGHAVVHHLIYICPWHILILIPTNLILPTVM